MTALQKLLRLWRKYRKKAMNSSMNTNSELSRFIVNGPDAVSVPESLIHVGRQFQQIMMMYTCAIREVRTKLEVLNDELSIRNQRNPIEMIKARVKKPESIVEKLHRRGFPITLESVVNNLDDVAGIRVICSFTSDIYRIADMLRSQNDIRVISVKDYMRHPKESGYKSYHMLVTVPVFLSDRIVDVKVEIQIRTVAMDFWASLEHKINYKFEGRAPEHIRRELVECAKMVSQLDARMLALNEEIQSLEEKKETASGG